MSARLLVAAIRRGPLPFEYTMRLHSLGSRCFSEGEEARNFAHELGTALEDKDQEALAEVLPHLVGALFTASDALLAASQLLDSLADEGSL